MEKKRKPDYFYIDNYDRWTIRKLKELETKEAAEMQDEDDPIRRFAMEFVRGTDSMAYRNTAILRARDREVTIREWIRADEHKDHLIEKHPLPKGVTCNLCGKAMRFSTYFFDVQSIPLLFVFECSSNHGPRKAIYPNGQEHVFPRPTCKKCGYEVIRESHNKNNILCTITTCSMCGIVEKDELDLNFEPEEEFVITEEDRQKYCLSFFKERTFLEDLEAINNFVIEIDEGKKDKELKEYYEIDKIERLTIPALEVRLQKAIENEGFIKLSFDRPEMKTWTVVPFNLQDSSDRNDKKSIKTITTCIKQTLFTTNWRLVGSVDYRLGFLTGKLKAFEHEEDLIKLAIEIKGSAG